MHRVLKIMGGTAATFASCWLMGGAWAYRAPAPVMVIDKPSAAVSSRGPGQAVEHAFHVRNAGNLPLQLRVVETSCTCATVVSDHKLIPPGKSTSLWLRVHPESAGVATYRAVVESNDRAHTRLTLALQVHVPQTASFYPESLYLSALGSASAHGETTLTAPAKARLKGFVTTASWLNLQATPKSSRSGPESWTIAVGAGPGAPVGESHVEALFEIDSQTIRLPIVMRRFDSGKAAPPEAANNSAPSRPALRMLYTTDLSGFLAPCGCVPEQLGGVARLATLADRLRRESKETLLLDGGGAIDRPEKAPIFAQVLSLLGYSACAMSANDLSIAYKLWREALTKRRIAMTSSTSAPGWLIRRTGIGQVGIISIPETKNPSRALESAARVARTKLPGQVRAIVVLSRLGTVANVKLARKLWGLQTPVVIFGRTPLPDALPVDSVLLAPVGNRGMYLVSVDLSGGKKPRFLQETAHRHPVRSDIPQRSDVLRLVAGYYDDQKHLISSSSAKTPSLSCGGCHREELASWRRTSHARAIRTLKAKNRLVPDCVPCHSESFRRTGVLSEDGVNCMTCHRKAREHAADRKHKHTVSATAESDCVTCHSPAQQINRFNYPKSLEAIRH